MEYKALLLSIVLIYLFDLVNDLVPYVYMDEFFHVRQTLQYITERDFTTWDPKITTPPGLYILGYLLSKLTNPSLLALRAINLVPVLLTLGVAQFSSPQFASRAVIFCGFPLLAFYTNLYYTDVWSTILCVSSFLVPNSVVSAVLLSVSLWFRQTNIIWAALAAVFRIVTPEETFGQVANFGFVKRAITVGLPYMAVAAQFAAFLVWNGGIAMGDKSNHAVAAHLAQTLYFLMFFAFFSWPILAGRVVKRGFPELKRVFGGNPLRAIIELAVIYEIIKYGTIVHPFILADNRHYTFYIWRRLITPADGLLLVPVYWVSWRWFASTLNFRQVRVWAFILATFAVLIPSPLMEPRYYIVPYLVWRMFLYTQEITNIEFLWNIVVNAGTTFVFAMTRTHFMW